MDFIKTIKWIAGVDEAGRGPLAGPVVAAAVILNPDIHIVGLTDSKLLTAGKREALFARIQETALAWGVGRADFDEIDRVNILQATLLAMQRAIFALSIKPSLVLIDGNQKPSLPFEVKAIVKGDLTEPAISAASIVAKVTRDHEMMCFDKAYPEYGFARHKGYGTAEHLAALKKYGPCPIHRRSFAGVQVGLETSES